MTEDEKEARMEMKAKNIWQIVQHETIGDAAAILAVVVHNLHRAGQISPEENKRIFSDALDDVAELIPA